MSAKCLLILSVETISIFMDLLMAELIKLAKMAGVMHEADHAYSISGAPGDCVDYLPMYHS